MREGLRAKRAVMGRKGGVTIKRTGYKFADLTEEKLETIRKLEDRLEVTLIAYRREKG